ncbi:mannosyl-oligosaccharide glucosidase GCS1 isoform X1 [Gastrolobium bilobum]|uniref:mannosyl-oligosaccharide glucosidase GCS1 isoform X1 n=1 Tax=Gastrolobium bilobum TaxID=150636 RepID=UPI002AB20014|nr:mannosyl-oligosaccharide glucosidase GCS1 isoform X1 [Gastrolobium bilobum]
MTGSGRRTVRNRVRSSSDADDDSLRERRDRLKRHRVRSKYGSSIPIFNNANLKVVLGVSFLAFFIIVFLIRHVVNSAVESQLPRAVTPFPAPKIMDLPQFQGQHKESLYWGTYRPHVYLGIRARTPKSLIAGLMWIGVKDGRYHLRHVCKHEDGLSTYGWTKHNGRDFGHQVLVDHGMTLATGFLKSKGDVSGYGGDWAVRIDVQIDKSKWNEEFGSGAQLFFYLADEGSNVLDVSRENLNIHEDSLLASGSRPDIGDWQLHLKSTDDLELHYSGFNTPHFHNLSDLVEENLASQIRKHARLQLSDSSDDSPNVFVFQIIGGFPFTTDIVLISGTGSESSRVEERVSNLTGTSLSNQLTYKEQAFDEKFEKIFNLAEKVDSESISVGKAAVGNLLGGIGYFYGQSKIAVSRIPNLREHLNYISYWPAELYTAVPSRSFFPRGFLWDEGFHQLLIWRWDIHISLDIIGHWLDLMNIDGWIPREQVLGAEALSRVPEEFVPQYPTNGNPPTLFLALNDIINGLKNKEFTSIERSEISLFLERAFVRLEAWFQWFNTTQSGNQMSSYYWHGRDNRTMRELNPKTLSSGLDDYPRASHPSADERHLDLRCWMLFAADCMHSIEELLDKETKPGRNYGYTAKLLSDHELLNQMHFDDAYGAYFDFGNHTEKVQLKWKEMEVGQNYDARQLVRDVLERPVLRLVPHIGYVSLFPFMGRIIPSGSWILEKQLELISNRSLLWTDYGLRSLAKTSSLYMKRNTEHDPPYWRGPIWINMNYRILSALHHYSKENGPYQDRAKVIYEELRSNLIRNIVRNYQQTGFLWEQYDQIKGKGKGTHPFTGWTSLVVLIMAEAYDKI